KALQAHDPAELENDQALHTLANEIETMARNSHSVAVFPPAERAHDAWLFTDDAMQDAFGGGAQSTELLADWEALEGAKHDPAAFDAGLEKLHARVVGVAEQRGEYAKVPLELSFYRCDFFTRALVSFLGAFVLLCASWLAPRTKWLVK